jgi:hypothetical protein
MACNKGETYLLMGKYSGRGSIIGQGGMWRGPNHGILFCGVLMFKVKFTVCYFLRM